MKEHYMHWRYDKNGDLRRYYRGKSCWTPQGCGGRTLCVLTLNGQMYAMGEAIAAKTENFCYAKMREMAYDAADRQISIKFFHWRYDEEGRLRQWAPEYAWVPRMRGGHTLCVIETQTGLVGMGESACDVQDVFSVTAGMEKSRERAEREIWYVDNVQEDEELD